MEKFKTNSFLARIRDFDCSKGLHNKTGEADNYFTLTYVFSS